MVYLEYLLLIIIIFLLYILVIKLYKNNFIKGFNYVKNFNVIEGFEHKGDSVVAGKQKDEESLQEKFKKPEAQLEASVKTSYTVADEFSYMVISIPFKILNKLGKKIYGSKDTFKPIIRFIKRTLNKLRRAVKNTYKATGDIFKQLTDLGFNAVDMAIEMPSKILDMMIGLQGTIKDLMTKTLKIPFSDQLFV